jgi:hypothetical protein
MDHTEFVGRFMIYLKKKINMSSSNGSLVIVIK